MNKRQARYFAIGSTLLATLVFLGLTIDSHRQFPKLTNAQNITPEVTLGKNVWHKNNCINCHTIFGEGAYYAPDLTKIAQQRGAPYLRAFLKDPSKFYDEQRHRRLMPQQDLSDADIDGLIAFLDWVSKVDNQDWPPRPIMVTGLGAAGGNAASPAAAAGSAAAATASDKNPVALGERVFRSAAPACTACHSLTPGADMAGPSLAGIATRTQETLASPNYKGSATDLATYIRESITHPSAHLVAGAMYSANGVSFMPNTYQKDLTPEQLAHLAAYLATFK
ncbi:nitric-oxide reductase subunit C [Hydrogenophaga taeniospiralis CCUG 15921]|uniref:Nitric-oxide reductase subunit C n=1 Tax=Hydrogenophaga taeniospiralis CCUG 15921 TaxID=1281780 RepID=A0A9X4NPY2_9BURK|nr:c-type cytochrome [Hydrogenophaga taeniospiralis]MDG5975187.1 nitric-oxide reductase subunit C [Hydrogenophaga taeniospiralis CCUG 15921]